MENIKWFARRMWRWPVAQNGIDTRLFGWSPVMTLGLGLWIVALVVMLIWLDAPVAGFMYHTSGAVTQFASTITRIGDSTWMIVVLTIALILILPWRFMRWGAQRALFLRNVALDLFFALYCIVASGLIITFIKNVLGRARPKLLAEHGHLYFDAFEFKSDLASFPSGHSTTFGAACMVLALRWPNMWPLWLALAIMGGASRVMVGAHYPSDVLAGLTFGALYAWWTARFLAQRGVMFRFRNDTLTPTRRLPGGK